MTTSGRTLSSSSASANTGMHSTADIPGLGSGAQFTVFFWFKSTGTNANNTLWASETGDCQIYYNSGTEELRCRYGNNATGGTTVFATQGAWSAISVQMGLNIAGSTDVEVECLDITTSTVYTDSLDVTSSASEIEADGVHYVLGDDAGGSPTDDGFIGKIFGLALIDGRYTLDELGANTTTDTARDFDATPEAAIIYALRGQTAGSPGADNSGNGNDFTVEGSGVVFDEADLPPGVSVPSTEPTGAPSSLTSGTLIASPTGTPAAVGIVGALLGSTKVASPVASLSVSGAPLSLLGPTKIASPTASAAATGTVGSLTSTTLLASPVGSTAVTGAPNSLLGGTVLASPSGTPVASGTVGSLLAGAKIASPTATFSAAGAGAPNSLTSQALLASPTASSAVSGSTLSLIGAVKLASPSATTAASGQVGSITAGALLASPTGSTEPAGQPDSLTSTPVLATPTASSSVSATVQSLIGSINLAAPSGSTGLLVPPRRRTIYLRAESRTIVLSLSTARGVTA